MISTPLLAAAGVLVILALISAAVLLRSTREDKALLARIEAVSAIGRPKTTAALPSITRKARQERVGGIAALTGLVGFYPARADQYRIKWYWVILIALGTGRIAVTLAAGMLGWIAWLMFPVVAFFVARTLFIGMLSKRADKLRGQLPDALSLVVRAVRVGIPVGQALRAVSRESQQPTSAEFDRLSDQLAIGVPLDTALRAMAVRNGLPEYGFLAAALSIQAQTGGGLSETLDLLADVTRKRVAMKVRGHALSSEARTSSMILGALPVVSGVLLYALNPDYMGILFSDPTGRMILGAAILSLSTGMFVMRVIIRLSLA